MPLMLGSRGTQHSATARSSTRAATLHVSRDTHCPHSLSIRFTSWPLHALCSFDRGSYIRVYEDGADARDSRRSRSRSR